MITNARRDFLKTTFAGGMAAIIASRLVHSVKAAVPVDPVPPAIANDRTKVALTNGDQRADNIIRALKSLEKDIKAAIGNRRVVIKPNLVAGNNALACSHSDGIAAILDFLKSIGKLENAIIAESSAGPTMAAFENQNYPKLADKYNVKLLDLDTDKFQTIMAFDQTTAKPKPVRVSSILANQAENFIISACMPKTHNYAIATMSIKNIILGAGMKFSTAPAARAGAAAGGGARGGGAARGGAFGFFQGTNDKTILHGGGAFGININLSMLAPLLHPSLAVIDGYEGMEGNGPGNGTKVDHKICVVSLDYLAADTVGALLMGIDPGNLGYVTYLSEAGVGEGDVKNMEILGEPIAKLAKKYALPPAVQTQMQWKNPASVQPV